MIFAPVVVFAYNRPNHICRVLESLQRCRFSSQTVVYVFADAPKNKASEEDVARVRQVVREFRCFKELILVEREKNLGLAASIVDGVTSVVEEHGKVIVLEDDTVVSPAFLAYMNKSLNYYSCFKKIWHISGWGYPLNLKNLGEDVFSWRVMNCWGWGTWRDRWKMFSRDPELLVREFSKQDINRFNLDGVYPFWDQVLLNKKGRLDTWAVFWYATIFKHGGLCVSPYRTYVRNIGNDGTGVNCSTYDVFFSEEICMNEEPVFCDEMIESRLVVDEIKRLYQDRMPGLFERGVRRLLVSFGRFKMGRIRCGKRL